MERIIWISTVAVFKLIIISRNKFKGNTYIKIDIALSKIIVIYFCIIILIYVFTYICFIIGENCINVAGTNNEKTSGKSTYIRRYLDYKEISNIKSMTLIYNQTLLIKYNLYISALYKHKQLTVFKTVKNLP